MPVEVSSQAPDPETLEKEIALVRAILDHPAGYDLDLMGVLRIRTTEENIEVEYELVEDEPYPEGCVFKYNAANRRGRFAVFDFNLEDFDKAVRFFVETRFERQLGVDIEADLWRQERENSQEDS